MTKRLRLLPVVAAPVPALVVGVVVMRTAGVPAGVWSQNVAAALVGAGICSGVAAWRADRRTGSLAWSLLVFGLAALAVTLLGPGLGGVHRWVQIGHLRLHVAAVLVPAMLVALCVTSGGSPSVGAACCAVAVSVLLFAQPDGAQAVSFAAGWSIIAAASRRHAQLVAALLVLALAGATLLRADPLNPVPHVEGIVRLAREQGTSRALAGVASLLLLPLPLLMTTGPRRLRLALAAYLSSVVLAAWLGPYPVPVMGFGMAPVLGYYLGIAAFAGIGRGAGGGGSVERERPGRSSANPCAVRRSDTRPPGRGR